jgi:predicted N-acyltransferase
MIEIISGSSYNELNQSISHLDINSPFLNIDFFKALEKSKSIGKNTGWISFPIVAKKNNQIIGFMPIFLKEHSYGEYVFDHSWADAFQQHGLSYYPKMISAIPFTPITGTRLLSDDIEVKKAMIKAIEKILVEYKISSCHILFPDKKDHELFNEMGWLSRKGVQFKWLNDSYQTFNEFLQTLSHNKRKKIKQERKKIETNGISIERKKNTDISNEDIDFFYECYCETYRLHNSTPYLQKSFFYELFKIMPNKLLIIIAKKNGMKIASAFSIIGEDTLYGRYWGALEFVSGLHFELCYYQGQEFCIENRIKYFEGGAQGEHKLARGFKPFDTYSNHYITQPDFRVAISNFLNDELSRVSEYSDELEERTPYKKIN